ncbi:hypothetical protein [Autumnicola lenta]
MRVASAMPENLPNVVFRTPDGKTAEITQNKNSNIERGVF